MASQRFIQLLRSSSIYNSFADAKAALEALTGRKDGEIVLARYNSTRPGAEEGTTVPYVDSAIGVYRVTDSPAASYCTVFQSSEEVEKLIAEVQAELDATQIGAGLGEEGAYTAPASGEAGYEVLGGQDAPESLYEAIMALADAIAAMDHSNNYTAAAGANPATATDASKVISGVNQVNGVLDTVTTDAVDLLLTGYANDGTTHTGAISASDTVETALNKLENATAAGVKISEQAGNQIHRLTATGEEGLATKLSIAALSATEISNLPDGANVREAYKLVDLNASDSTVGIGLPIKIYKDSALTNVFLGHVDDILTNENQSTHESPDTAVTSGSGDSAICFIYHLENGNYKLQAVDLGDFLEENEFSDGLVVANHVVSVNAGDGLGFDASSPKKVVVKKDSSSEQVYTAAATAADVLTVGANGVKVANVQAAINFATDQVLSTVVGSSDEALATANTPHISISESTDNTTGLHSYSVSESDIASEDLVNAITGQTLGAAMTYSGTPTYIGQAQDGNNITKDLEALDAAVADNLKSVSGSNAINVAAKDANKDQAISLILDDSTVGTGTELTGNYNALSVTNDGLFLSNIWDCGQY